MVPSASAFGVRRQARWDPDGRKKTFCLHEPYGPGHTNMCLPLKPEPPELMSAKSHPSVKPTSAPRAEGPQVHEVVPAPAQDAMGVGHDPVLRKMGLNRATSRGVFWSCDPALSYPKNWHELVTLTTSINASKPPKKWRHAPKKPLDLQARVASSHWGAWRIASIPLHQVSSALPASPLCPLSFARIPKQP